MSEALIVRDILRYLKTLDGGYFCKVSDRFTHGIPDILGVFKGKGVAFEVKTEDGKTSVIQKWVLSRIKKAGGIAEVVRSVDDVKRILEKI